MEPERNETQAQKADHHQKDVLVSTGDALAKAGLVCLSLTVTTVLALIFCVVAGVDAASVVAVAAALFFAICWLILPLWVQRSSGKNQHRNA